MDEMADDNTDLRAILDAAADTQGSSVLEFEDASATDIWDPLRPMALIDGARGIYDSPDTDDNDTLRAIADMENVDPLAVMDAHDTDALDNMGRKHSRLRQELGTTYDRHDSSFSGFKKEVEDIREQLQKLEQSDTDASSKQRRLSDDLGELRRQATKNSKMISCLDNTRHSQTAQDREAAANGGPNTEAMIRPHKSVVEGMIGVDKWITQKQSDSDKKRAVELAHSFHTTGEYMEDEFVRAFIEGHRVELRNRGRDASRHTSSTHTPDGLEVNRWQELIRGGSQEESSPSRSDVETRIRAADTDALPSIPKTPTGSQGNFMICTPPGISPTGTEWTPPVISKGSNKERDAEMENRLEVLEGVILGIKTAVNETTQIAQVVEGMRDSIESVCNRLEVVEEQSLTQRAELIEVERNIQVRIDEGMDKLRRWFKEELKGIRDVTSHSHNDSKRGTGKHDDSEMRGEVKGIAKRVELMAPKLMRVESDVSSMRSAVEKCDTDGAKVREKIVGIEDELRGSERTRTKAYWFGESRSLKRRTASQVKRTKT